MATAAEIARAAWIREDEARQARQATLKRQQEAAARRARVRSENAARSRLARSVIPNWFPDVEWSYLDTRDDKDIWSSGADYDEIKLAVLHKVKNGKGLLRVEFVSGREVLNPPYPCGPPREIWVTESVNSIADIWQAKRDWDKVTTPPQWGD